MADPYRIAVWRYEQIAPFEDLALTQAERAALIAQLTDHPVLWPSGKEEPIPRSTLYSWLAAYRKPCRRCEKRKKCPDDKHCERQLQALLPKRRDDLGKARSDRGSFIQKAIQMLLVRPARSLTLLLAFLKARFLDDLELTRSTLQRELHAHPLWPVILRRRKGDKRLRTRFEPRFVHETWHLDGKGPFTVRLESGGEIRVTILTILEAFVSFRQACMTRRGADRYPACQSGSRWPFGRRRAYEAGQEGSSAGGDHGRSAPCVGVAEVTKTGDADAGGVVEHGHAARTGPRGAFHREQAAVGLLLAEAPDVPGAGG